MKILRWAGLAIGILLGVALTLIIGYVAYASWAWRDLPAAEVDARYAGEDLRTASVDGLDLRYRWDPATADRPVLVLIHSHFLDMGMWDGWVQALHGQASLLRYDLAGHGLTGPDASGVYGVDRDVDLLRGLLDTLGIARASIVGSSLGGNIAFTFAARHPDRVERLVLINSGGLKRQNSRSGGSIPGWADHIMPLVPAAAWEHFLGWMIADDRVIDAALITRFVTMLRRRGNRRAELARLRQFDTGAPGPLLAAITAPTLIQWGEANPQLPVELAERFREALTGAATVKVVTYPGAGHVLPLERPESSARDTLEFLHAPNPTGP